MVERHSLSRPRPGHVVVLGVNGERKVPSTTPTPPQRSSSLVSATPDASFGTTKPLALHLLKLLEEWHLRHPDAAPPCSGGRYDTGAWKVFDRENRALELSRFHVSSPCSYYTLVLHCADGAEKMCGLVGERGTKYGRYLIGWMGLETGFESEVCAIRVSGLTLDSIVLDPNAWQHPPKDITPMRLCRARQSFEKREAPQWEPDPKRQLREKQLASSGKTGTTQMQPHIRRLREGHSTDYRILDAEGLEEELKSSASSSSGEDSSMVSDGGDIPYDGSRNLKRRRVDSRSPSAPGDPRDAANANSNHEAAQPFEEERIVPATKDWEVVFKFVHEASFTTLEWAAKRSEAGKELFAQARQWYRIIDKDAKVRLLSFQIPDSVWKRHIFKGNSGMVERFLDEVKSIKAAGEDTITIEVKCVI